MLFTYGGDVAPGRRPRPKKSLNPLRKTKGLFSSTAPLLRGDFKARPVTSDIIKDLLLGMTESGQAGHK